MLTYRGLKGTKEVVKETYDFSKAGGALGAIDLFKFPAKTIIHNMWYEVETAVTSGGSATVEVGYSGGTPNLLKQKAIAGLTANYVSADADKGTDLLDGTDKNSKKKKFTAEATLQMLIATAALTAGKIHFYAEVSEGY